MKAMINAPAGPAIGLAEGGAHLAACAVCCFETDTDSPE